MREIVLSGCQGRCGLRPFYNKEEKKLAEENMQRMGITELADRCYRELSGGQPYPSYRPEGLLRNEGGIP